MPQSLWPLGLFLFVGTGARVTASTPKIRQAFLAPSRNSHFAWDCNQRSFQRAGGLTRRADASRRGAVARIRTERICPSGEKSNGLKRNLSEKGVLTLYRLLSSKAQLATHFTASISISAFL